MGQGLSDPNIVLCKVRIVGAWIKRREVVVGARRIRSEKLRKHHYRVGYYYYCSGSISQQAVLQAL